ncbi:CHAPERONE-LIKE PROTEIN OF POR1, chloroplastic [Olea europaea subsp. europaea]|uniref:CHAPERONE-LIKE PROTEIN OF POR1, chloroplastic n=1 Tax=Olea europaea subsp. europaea TaxID=158383 RepID=A0A8S0SMM3_OLEEU|nr:CHAPERONE-LIKE PROTEIN OF POR1, chloroplastic [Olea europaea subsp. europaea]
MMPEMRTPTEASLVALSSVADVPGLILATSFGASLYFLTKKNVKLGKAAVITIGGLVTGAIVDSAVESWLQVSWHSHTRYNYLIVTEIVGSRNRVCCITTEGDCSQTGVITAGGYCNQTGA